MMKDAKMAARIDLALSCLLRGLLPVFPPSSFCR